MAQYYVVRDKNTGLYFRGKGVNRWGKHYNQASIYRVRKLAENTIKEVSWHGEQAEVVPIQIIEGNADVVEVVRCKDCRHCKFNSSAEIYKCDRRGYFTETVSEDDFCSYGERKETHDNI
jgi:hypothetical protein